MQKFISIIGANLLIGSLYAAPVIDIHKVTSNDSATNEISDKETSSYSNIQLSVSGVTIKSNISDSSNYGLVAWDTFLKNSNLFFNDDSYTELNNTVVSVSSSDVDWQGYITSSSFDFNITLDGNSSLFDDKISYGIFIKDAATGGQAQTSLYLIDNTKPQIVNANIADDILYITFDEDLSDGSGTSTTNGTILSDLNEDDFNISTTGVVLSSASFASNNKKRLQFSISGTDITGGDINISGAIVSTIKDITGNPLDSDAMVIIKPAPMVLDAKTVNTTDFTLEYSKTMTVGDTNTSCADKTSNYTILDSSNNSLSGIVSIASIATSDNTTFTLTLTGATILNSGELNITASGILYSGWQVNVNANVADSSSSYTINDSGEVTFEVEDYISAIPSNPIWYDEDFDGKLDKLEITFDEPMNTNISSMASGVLSVRHDGSAISENNFNLDSLTWSYDELTVYIPLKSGYELDDTSVAADDTITLTGTGSNLTDANGNIEIDSLASTLPIDKASPIVTSLEFYDNYGMESFSTTDSLAEFNTSGTKDSISSDILKIYFSETLTTLDDTLISISTDYGYNYTTLVDGTVGLSSDNSYAIIDLSSDTITLNALRVKTSSAFATDSNGNSITSDIVYPTSLPISDESSFYIDSNDTLSVASTKVIIPFSENISTTAIELNSEDFAGQFSTTCLNISCNGIDTKIIDDTTIAVEFNSTVDDDVTFTYIPSSYLLQNSDKSKDLKKSNTLLTKTTEADSLDTNGSISFVTLKGILYQSDDSEAVMGTILTAFLATNAYQIKVSASDTINGESIGAGNYIITPHDSTLYNITVGSVDDINVSINYDDSNVTLTKGASSISFTTAESTLIDEVRVIEPFIVGSTVISETDGSYELKVRNPHGISSDVIILAKYGEDGDYSPVTSTINENSITVSGNTVDRYLAYSTVYGILNESIVVNLSMKNINKIELTQDSNKNFNTFYLPVKKSYYEYGNSDELTPSANRLNANSDLSSLELSSGYDLNDLLLSIKTENSKIVPYLVESNFNLTTRALKDGLTNCIKYDGIVNSSSTGISGFKAITAGYGIGCYIPEALDLYFFGEAITSSDTIESVSSISTWAMVGNWRYEGSLSGDSQNVSPSLDDNITQIVQYNSNTESSLYNLQVADDFRETIIFSTTQDGDDALFIQFNDDTTVTW